MGRTERPKRIARLVTLLSTNKKGSTIGQIVRSTGTSRATAYRDLELLRDCGSGVQLQTITVNGEARYSLIGSALAINSMTAREHAAIALARRALSAVEGSWPVRELDALLERCRASLREDDGVLLKLGMLAYDPALLGVVHQAVTERRMLRIRYRGAQDDAQQNRSVHPHRLQVVDQQPYLLAWDEAKRAMRTFKLARMTQAKLLRAKARIPPLALAEKATGAEPVKVWQSAPVAVRIRVAAPVVRYLREWPLVPSQQLEPAPRGAVDVCASILGIEEATRWVLRLGKNARVMEPPSLRARVLEELRGALAGYVDEVSRDRETGRARER